MLDDAKKYKILLFGAPVYIQRREMLKEVFPDHEYIDLEEYQSKVAFRDDPISFFRNFEIPTIYDNIQSLPNAFSFIERSIPKIKNGQVILGANCKVYWMNEFSKNLAKCTKTYELPGFSSTMILNRGTTVDSAVSSILSGNLPHLLNHNQNYDRYFEDILNSQVMKNINTYASRVPSEKIITLLRVLALQIDCPFDVSAVAEICELSRPTIRKLLQVLNFLYIIYPVLPYYKNYGKRQKKSTYYYFCNTGLLCKLLSISNVSQYIFHSLRGAIAKNATVSAICSSHLDANNNKITPYYFEDQTNNRVDLIVENTTKRNAYFVLDRINFEKSNMKKVTSFLKYSDFKPNEIKVYYPGEETIEFNGFTLISWKEV